MFTFEVDRMVPKFILQDKNGFALAQAIKAGLQMMNDIVEQSLRLVDDVDAMPEWRLDEIAWEKNLLYDKAAGIEQKRVWIRNADEDLKTYGTEYGIKRFLSPYFSNVTVMQYEDFPSIQPHHFRVYCGDEDITSERLAWALRAVNTVKNVRSICDGINITGSQQQGTYIAMYADLVPETGVLDNFILDVDMLD